MKGKVYLVGAGPGAADLLTLRAARLLEEADTVFHDALVLEDVLGMCTQAKRVPVGKRCGAHSMPQSEINGLLVAAAQRGEMVVRLKGGDPAVFGRVQEEIAALNAAGIPWEIVPGITAASAAAADLGISLTCRGEARSVLLATPRVGDGEERTDWAPSKYSADTLAIYMGGEETSAWSAALLAQGWQASTPVAVVVSASRPERRAEITRLDRLAAGKTLKHGGPVILLVGSVVERAVVVQERQQDCCVGQ